MGWALEILQCQEVAAAEDHLLNYAEIRQSYVQKHRFSWVSTENVDGFQKMPLFIWKHLSLKITYKWSGGRKLFKWAGRYFSRWAGRPADIFKFFQNIVYK